ncbi:MAG TPA: hypothetical protein VFI33_20375 [Puia sp.]|nr:hypothetical protein [Puia sp.]
MPESKDNFVVQGLSGTFAGIGTFHRRGKKTFLRKIRAKPSVPDSKEQVAVKERFAEYIQYAKAAIKDPVIKAAYAAAAKPGRTAFNRAVTDASRPPKIGKVDAGNYHGQTGDHLIIEATDDFRVKAVQVCIHNANGHLIEQGDAIMQINMVDWLYAVTAANESFAGSKITATASDLPGNKASVIVTLPGNETNS